MEFNEKQFISGFNAGFLLAEYEPFMLSTIIKNLHPIISYISEMKFGQKEPEFTKEKNALNQLDQISHKTRDDITRDKD